MTHRFRADQLDAEGKPYRFAVYAYRVRAVNALGVEGGPFAARPDDPLGPAVAVRARTGASCRPELVRQPRGGLAGLPRLPHGEPADQRPGAEGHPPDRRSPGRARFTDPRAGGQTRRYWVVAVDALGQEGFPSAPAWHYRQFRQYYEPFVGEWHQ